MSGIGRRFFMGVKLIGDSVRSKLEKKSKRPARAEAKYHNWLCLLHKLITTFGYMKSRRSKCSSFTLINCQNRKSLAFRFSSFLLFFIYHFASSYSFIISITPPVSLSQTNSSLYQTFETKK